MGCGFEVPGVQYTMTFELVRVASSEMYSVVHLTNSSDGIMGRMLTTVLPSTTRSVVRMGVKCSMLSRWAIEHTSDDLLCSIRSAYHSMAVALFCSNALLGFNRFV